MKILVGCEYSGVLRRRLRSAGYDAWSCDLLESADKSQFHIQKDILSILDQEWDMGIFFTPCTFLCNSGIKHLYIGGKKENGINLERWELMKKDANLFRSCMNSNIHFIANENPIMHPYAKEIIGKKQDQIIQPYQFGHLERKATCLWLKNLPKLVETNNVMEEMKKLPKKEAQRIHYMSPSKNRGLERSITYDGVADAMTSQWTKFAQSINT